MMWGGRGVPDHEEELLPLLSTAPVTPILLIQPFTPRRRSMSGDSSSTPLVGGSFVYRRQWPGRVPGRAGENHGTAGCHGHPLPVAVLDLGRRDADRPSSMDHPRLAHELSPVGRYRPKEVDLQV